MHMLNYVVAHSGRFGRFVTRFAKDKSGASALEYGILLGLVGAGIAVAVPPYLAGLNSMFTAIGNAANAVVVAPF